MLSQLININESKSINFPCGEQRTMNTTEEHKNGRQTLCNAINFKKWHSIHLAHMQIPPVFCASSPSSSFPSFDLVSCHGINWIEIQKLENIKNIVSLFCRDGIFHLIMNGKKHSHILSSLWLLLNVVFFANCHTFATIMKNVAIALSSLVIIVFFQMEFNFQTALASNYTKFHQISRCKRCHKIQLFGQMIIKRWRAYANRMFCPCQEFAS